MAWTRESIGLKELQARGNYKLEQDALDTKEEEEKKRWWYFKALKAIQLKIEENERTAAEEMLKKHKTAFDIADKVFQKQIEDAAENVFDDIPLAEDLAQETGKLAGKNMAGGMRGTLAKGVLNIKDNRKVAKYTTVFAAMGIGAAIGAVLGTVVFPGIGTAIGGALGGAIGGLATAGVAIALAGIGAWLGAKIGRFAYKKLAPDTRGNYQIFRNKLNKLTQETKLTPVELTELNAYTRNREKSMEKGENRKALAFIRSRAFKKGAKQGIEHLIFFLVDDLKALKALEKPNAKQKADIKFLEDILNKLKDRQNLDPEARNQIKRFFGEKAIVAPNDQEKKFIKRIKLARNVDDLIRLLEAFEPDIADNLGRRKVDPYEIADLIKHAKENNEDLFHLDLHQVNDVYGIQEKLKELAVADSRQQVKQRIEEAEKAHIHCEHARRRALAAKGDPVLLEEWHIAEEQYERLREQARQGDNVLAKAQNRKPSMTPGLDEKENEAKPINLLRFDEATQEHDPETPTKRRTMRFNAE